MILQKKQVISVGDYAPDFELPGTDGQVHHLASYLHRFRAIGVVFMGNSSSYVSLYLERLKHMQEVFGEQGFTLVGINANDPLQVPEDSFEEMETFAQQQQLNFPYLWDSSQDVALSFAVQSIPEVFLLNDQGIICYRGAIDDQPQHNQRVKNAYLYDNVAILLNGEKIVTTTTKVVGCDLKWRKCLC